MEEEKIIDVVKDIYSDTSALSGGTEEQLDGNRILDYIKEIREDTNELVEGGGGGGGGSGGDYVIASSEQIQALFS